MSCTGRITSGEFAGQARCLSIICGQSRRGDGGNGNAPDKSLGEMHGEKEEQSTNQRLCLLFEMESELFEWILDMILLVLYNRELSDSGRIANSSITYFVHVGSLFGRGILNELNPPVLGD